MKQSIEKRKQLERAIEQLKKDNNVKVSPARTQAHPGLLNDFLGCGIRADGHQACCEG